jgi:hypothetical protein
MKIRRGFDRPTEMQPSDNRGAAGHFTLSAHYLKPFLNRQRRLEAVLELVARLAVRAALKLQEEHVESSSLSSDNEGMALTLAESHVKV